MKKGGKSGSSVKFRESIQVTPKTAAAPGTDVVQPGGFGQLFDNLVSAVDAKQTEGTSAYTFSSNLNPISPVGLITSVRIITRKAMTSRYPEEM